MPKPSKPAPLFVALLRGINVGGNNMISMRSLKDSFERMGFTGVVTYINSGNIIFRAKDSDGRKLEQKIERMLEREYKLGCKVVVRSFAEMAALVKSLPKTWDGDESRKYHVIFLRHSIDSRDIVERMNAKPDIEEVVYRPGTLLWSVKVSDVNRTAMQKLPGQKIFQDMTVRNLNTTKKIYELMKSKDEEEG
jgi:uncharacterized protein (DUF1697 family)